MVKFGLLAALMAAAFGIGVVAKDYYDLCKFKREYKVGKEGTDEVKFPKWIKKKKNEYQSEGEGYK